MRYLLLFLVLIMTAGCTATSSPPPPGRPPTLEQGPLIAAEVNIKSPDGYINIGSLQVGGPPAAVPQAALAPAGPLPKQDFFFLDLTPLPPLPPASWGAMELLGDPPAPAAAPADPIPELPPRPAPADPYRIEPVGPGGIRLPGPIR
jgi:hypothetical protein